MEIISDRKLLKNISDDIIKKQGNLKGLPDQLGQKLNFINKLFG